MKQEIRRWNQVEETLRQNEERYRLFFDSISDGVVVVDTNGIIVECSRSATLPVGCHMLLTSPIVNRQRKSCC